MRISVSKPFLVLSIMSCLMALPIAGSADELDDIKERGKIVVAIDPTFAPYEYTDSAGKIIGYTPQIMQEVAKRLGVKVEYQTMAFNGIIPGLLAKSFDLEGSTLNITPERSKRVLFTVPFGKSVNAVLVRADDNRFADKLIVESISGLTAIVKATTAPERILKQFNEILTEKKLPLIKILSLDTVEQTSSALLVKRGDFVFDDISVMGAVLKKNAEKFRQVGELGPMQWMAWATRKDDVRLNKFIGDTILDMQKTGKLASLQKKELGVVFEVPADGFIPKD